MNELPEQLRHAIAAVPVGRWGIGVSGGADSVGLFRLMKKREDITLVAIHLDHQLRGDESDGDAAFVRQLAERHGVPLVIRSREQMQAEISGEPVKTVRNKSALYRALRLKLFAMVAVDHQLDGVLLAHHADDQAETLMLRLMRGSSERGMVGMAQTSHLGGLTVMRPLLNVRREVLRQWLESIEQQWREDSSNQSRKYARNRVRQWLADWDELTPILCEMAQANRQLREVLSRMAPKLEDPFELSRLWDLPGPVAAEACRKWLCRVGCPAGEITDQAIGQLLQMSNDAASSPRVHFPGGKWVMRKQGKIGTLRGWKRLDGK